MKDYTNFHLEVYTSAQKLHLQNESYVNMLYLCSVTYKANHICVDILQTDVANDVASECCNEKIISWQICCILYVAHYTNIPYPHNFHFEDVTSVQK